jgi:hypothetical protein
VAGRGRPAERTGPVTSGAFRLARNPVFTAMIITGSGLMLMVPNLVAIAGLVGLLIAIQFQVRVVEDLPAASAATPTASTPARWVVSSRASEDSGARPLSRAHLKPGKGRGSDQAAFGSGESVAGYLSMNCFSASPETSPQNCRYPFWAVGSPPPQWENATFFPAGQAGPPSLPV